MRGYQFGGMPRFGNCLGTDPLGGGIGGDTAAVLPGLKLGSPFILTMWTMLICGSLLARLAGTDVILIRSV